jgi:hypothetical protein
MTPKTTKFRARKTFTAAAIAACGGALALSANAAASPSGLPDAPGHYTNAASKQTFVRPQGMTPPSVDADDVGKASGNPFSADYMLYRGGPVQLTPEIYLVFWGNWSGDRYHIADTLYSFFAGVGGSGFNREVTQYAQGCVVNTYSCSTSAMHIVNSPGQLKGFWNDKRRVPKTPGWKSIAREAARAAMRFGDISINSQYVIALPPGHGDQLFKAGEACGWHSSTGGVTGSIQYISLPYMPDAGTACGNYSVTNSIVDGATIVASHEYIETETDPWGGAGIGMDGWNDSTGVSGEVGDKCAWDPPAQLAKFTTGIFPVQAIWSNYDRYFHGFGCIFGV